jgi:hypothetical protein
MERLVDRFIRDEMAGTSPLHPNQHAYQAGKSTETALHQLVVRVEKVLDQKETALGVFLDIEGAFNNTSYDSISAAMARHGVNQTVIRWVRATLEGRSATAALGVASKSIGVTKGCPQGGVLSPLLWSLVVDELLVGLNQRGIYAQGYADDICLLAKGKFPNTISGLMQWALDFVEEWCDGHGLTVNPDKTELVAFTRRRKLPGFFEPRLYGTTLRLSVSAKYLGVILEARLAWKKQVEARVRKARHMMGACRRVCGRRWGLRPRVVSWLFTSVVRPSITYASLVWWPGCETTRAQQALSSVQRLACLGITGAMRTTPTNAMEALVGLHCWIWWCRGRLGPWCIAFGVC